MLSAEDGKEAGDVERMLAGARNIVASVQYCWLVSRSDESVRARPMGRILSSESNHDWTIRFLTDLRSRKIADLRHASNVGLIFQNDGDDAYASLAGAARLVEDVSEVRALWKEDAHARYFPTAKDRANACFIEVRIERMELWIRGVTPEPFGLHATILQRDPKGAWYWVT
ncbi:pyridoxamine 5'-phosphate oxidase family protein [Bradyrhizobium sp.]|jgi:general stress protein 26|uniref:pyridoxamine 5'-phosphate oxidase family protein n=1 Tax=Bradyrhizobium sp. TaxID=376 RepID=UPI002C490BCF|nr:pyridoxamine 5'-phosphate oxidase family protein [Bradyrhizobium sp.]HWX57253.1 pyridoxamine 5'-phosphate oxidase family protein [Bradyrhizobium sp.]